VWPSPADANVVITPAQLDMLLEGIDWRMGPGRHVIKASKRLCAHSFGSKFGS
jgi:transposase